MNALLNYGVLICIFGCFVEIDGSCETVVSSDWFYNRDTRRWGFNCPYEEHIFAANERRGISGCRECVCQPSGLVCCRTDEGVGAMAVPDDCMVVSDDSSCGYQILRRDDNTPCF